MTEDPTPSSVTRRNFLATTSTFPLGAMGLTKVFLASEGAYRAAPEGARIVKLGIYPPMGICRPGNSKKYFLAHEIPELPALPDGDYKDSNDRIKKQAQSFRIYGFYDQGRVVREVTAERDRIEWSIDVANTKASRYGCNNPLDSGEKSPGLPGQIRNQFWSTPKDRENHLIIDPGEKTISGKEVNPD